MYRAKVEAISGIKIFAGGKWLQCIGNKNVNVGDYIWTDGRCVYGHNQQPQQPLVITLPNEDEAIPIVMYEFGEYRYYIYKSKLKMIGSNQIDYRVFDAGIINGYSYNKKIIYYRRITSSSSINNQLHIAAYNIDKKGNKYKLQHSYAFNQKRLISNYYITVERNGEEISKLDFTHLMEKHGFTVGVGYSVEASYNMPYESYPVGTGGFIENENNWHCIVHVHSGYYPQLYWDFHYLETYLITPYGCKEIMRGNAEVDDREPLHFSANITPSNDKIKIPLQDGYYYTINFYTNLPDSMFCIPLFMNISVFNRNDCLLFTDTFHTASYITICEIKNDCYLMGVKIRRYGDYWGCDAQNKIMYQSIGEYRLDESYEQTRLDDTETLDTMHGYWRVSGAIDRYNTYYATQTPYIGNGLYLLQEKKLTKIVTGVCLNQRLRPMKKYKIWYHDIGKFS